MPYCGNFWHKDAHENIASPVSLLFFIIRDWSVISHPAKCHWSGDWPMASLMQV